MFESLLELFTVPNTAIDKDDFCSHLEKKKKSSQPANQASIRLEFQVCVSYYIISFLSKYTCDSKKSKCCHLKSKSVGLFWLHAFPSFCSFVFHVIADNLIWLPCRSVILYKFLNNWLYSTRIVHEGW